MNQLSPQARRLFELARGADDPGELERARVAHLLTGRLAEGSGTPAPRAGAGPKVVGASLKPALLALGLGGALVGAGFLASLRGGAVPSLPSVTSTAAAAPTRVSEAEGSARSGAAALAPLASAPNLASGADPEPAEQSARSEAPVAKPETPRRATTAVRGAPARPAAAGHDDAAGDADKRNDMSGSVNVDPGAKPVVDPLRAEAEALREAQRALRNGQARSALQLLAVQDARFAGGSLAEERAAARVLSLCQAGLAARARLEATRFAARWPRSALLSRVQAACPRE